MKVDDRGIDAADERRDVEVAPAVDPPGGELHEERPVYPAQPGAVMDRPVAHLLRAQERVQLPSLGGGQARRFDGVGHDLRVDDAVAAAEAGDVQAAAQEDSWLQLAQAPTRAPVRSSGVRTVEGSGT